MVAPPTPSVHQSDGHDQHGGRGERAARLALWALVLLFPVVYLPRVLGAAPPEPLPQPPAWVHTLVVTATRWPERPRLAHPAFEELGRRASVPRQAYATSPAQAGSAASLWTGRWAAHHGITSNGLALPAGAWTLARAALESGAATAAFLQEPFVSATGIGGFELVEESAEASADELARGAVRFLAAHADRRVLCWVHLVHAGPGGADAGAVVESLHRELDAAGRRYDTLLVVTGFGTDVPGGGPGADWSAADDAALRVPLWIELPAALYAGRRGAGAVSLVDVAGVVVELERLPRPDETAGQAPLQSRAQNLEHAIKGAGGYEWLFLHGPDVAVLRHGRTRVVARAGRDDAALVVQRLADPTRDAGFLPAPDQLRGIQVAQFRELERRAAFRATPPVPAEVPEAWRGRWGW